MQIKNLIAAYNFCDFKDTFLNIYGKYENIEFLNELGKLYDFYKMNSNEYKNSLTGEMVIIKQKDNDEEISYIPAFLNESKVIPLSSYSWFLTLSLSLSESTLKKHSNEEILSYYLYNIGYLEACDN